MIPTLTPFLNTSKQALSRLNQVKIRFLQGHFSKKRLYNSQIRKSYKIIGRKKGINKRERLIYSAQQKHLSVKKPT